MSDEQKPAGEAAGKKKGRGKGRTSRVVANNRAKMIRAVAEGKSPEEIATIGGLSTKNAKESVYQALRPVRPVVLKILADADHPIEKIFTEHLLPKLKAKRKIYHQGIQMSTEENDELQTHVALQICKMTGCYAAEKVQVDVNHSFTVDLSDASDDDIRAILSAGARASRAKSVGGSHRVVQEIPVSVDVGG